jgi:DNA-binding MarR family transcriptional regulator
VTTGADVAELSRVLFAVTRLGRENDLLLSAIARDLGLHLADFRAVAYVRVNSRVTPRDLADFLAHSMSATTATIDRLVASGYVRRTPNPEDGRSIYLEVTPQGARAVGEAIEIYDEALARAIPEQDLDDVADALSSIARAFAAATPRPGPRRSPR